MITHQEALELVRILFFNINEKTKQELNRTSKIYDKLDNYITQQEKKEKLLELYKELSNFYVKLYTMELSELSLNSNYYEIELIKLKQRIKELEKWQEN